MVSASMRLLVVALIVAATAGQRPKNQDGKDVQRTPPPGAENKRPVEGKQPPPSVGRSGDKASKMFLLQSNGFNVEVNAASPTPFFRFWSDTNNMQMVKLDRMFQTSTPDDLGSTSPLKPVRLPGAYEWTFGDTTESVDAATNTTDVSFTVTGAARAAGTAEKPTPGMVFTCHLLSNANGTEMKFDVDVTGFDDTWWGEGATALVIGYKISTVDENKQDKANLTMSNVRIQKGASRPNRPAKTGDESATKEKVAMDFGNGNGMEIVASAIEASTSATKWVKMTAVNTPDGGTYVLTMYEKFASGFSHDPNLYTASTSGTVDPNLATTFDGAAAIAIGADTGVAGGGTTPPPGGEVLSGASSLRCGSWAGVAALLAVAAAAVAGRV